MTAETLRTNHNFIVSSSHEIMPRTKSRGARDAFQITRGYPLRAAIRPVSLHWEKIIMQVADPVCGMKLEHTQAKATEVVQGQTLYFCSASCHDKYRADPGKYAKRGQVGGQAQGGRSC